MPKRFTNKKARGIKFLSEPFRIRTGWAVVFNDPSGNRLGFTDYKIDNKRKKE